MISNTAQINTFTSGMDTDTDINLLPNSKYRYGQDVRIVTDDQGTNGVLQSVDGAKKYNYGIKGTEEIIGTATVNDIAVVITKLQDGYNKIYRVQNFNSPNLVSTVVLKGKLNLCSDKDSNQLSVVLNYETASNIRAYFTDGVSSMKIINIMSDKYIKYPDIDNPLLDEDGNVLNPNAVDITPDSILPPFEVIDIVSGNLKAGMVQYCYRLYSKHSQQTTVSSLSNCVHLTSSAKNSQLIKYQGSQKQSVTGKGCSLQVDLISKDYDKCTIIRIFYEDNNATPIYSIIDDIDIDVTSNKISYIDVGNDGISSLTEEEFNSITNYQFVGRSLTSLQNRLFVSNITESSWVPMVKQDGKIVEYDARAYRANASGRVLLTTSDPDESMNFNIDDYATMKSIPKQYDCINPYNNTVDKTVINRYEFGLDNLYGGNGINIQYDIIKTRLDEAQANTTHDYKLLDDVSLNINSRSDATYQTIYNLQGSVYGSVKTVQGAHQANHADPIVASKFRSYQRDEIYRFGIVFYNAKAVASPVLWIGDIRFPDMKTAPITYEDQAKIISEPLGIRFRIKKMPIDAVAYEIVRCERTKDDKTILSQGVITPIYNYFIVEDWDSGEVNRGSHVAESQEYRPMPILHTKRKDLEMEASGRVNSPQEKQWITDNYWRFISPEVCYTGDKIEELFDGSAYIQKEAVYTSDFDTSGKNMSWQNRLQGCWFASNKKTIVPPNNDEYDVLNENKNVMTLSTQQYNQKGQLLLFGNVFCGAHVQKFYRNRTSEVTVGQHQKIDAAKYAMNIPYNKAQDGGVKPYKISIGTITYTNWATTQFWDGGKGVAIFTYGPAGPCTILKVQDSDVNKIQPVSDYHDSKLDLENALVVVNLKRDTIPYNGNTYSARTSSTYIPVSGYQKINDTIQSVMVFGGDTYIGILDYPAQMFFQRNVAGGEDGWNECKRYFGAYIPFESTINLKLSMGKEAHKQYDASKGNIQAYAQLEPIQMGVYYSQDKPFYLYNDAYSASPNGKLFVPRGLYDEEDVHSPNRIYVSQAKTVNENIDSWTEFKPADFIDVDARYGEVTNIKSIFNRLYFWQSSAFGILSVNDRALVQDNNIGQLVLGTGGILDRYDYVSIANGTKVINDRSIINSSSNIYWYDANKNEICKSNGSQVAIISKDCNVQSYVNNMYNQKTKGANSLYDKKYDEVWFRLYDKSLIYNERLNAFTSLYTFSPDFTLSLEDKVVTIKDNDFYIINSLDIDGFGDTSKDIQLQTVINKDIQYTKVFDNIALQGEFIAPDNKILRHDILREANFKTKHQTASRKAQDLSFDYREDTYRLPVPRQDYFEEEDNMSFPARMRGKYMICDYKFISDKDYSFQIPQITTTYRYSKI